MTEFAREHQSELFNAFAIDAGLLCLNTEDHFRKTLHGFQERYVKARKPTNLAPDELGADDLERAHRLIATGGFTFRHEVVDGVQQGRMMTSLAHFCEWMNERHALYNRRLETRGDPFLPDWIAGLRHSTGDWAYQGFAPLGPASSKAYMIHYDLDDVAQGTSDYRNALTELIALIRRHQDSLFASLQRTDDFAVFLADHEY